MSNKLNKLFETKAEETTTLNIWSGRNGQETAIMGVINSFGISEKYNTPYLNLDVDGEETVVFLSSGLINTFKFKRYFDANGDWNVKAETELINCNIAFKYVGEEKNPKSGRLFHKYMVAFEPELEKAGLLKKKN